MMILWRLGESKQGKGPPGRLTPERAGGMYSQETSVHAGYTYPWPPFFPTGSLFSVCVCVWVCVCVSGWVFVIFQSLFFRLPLIHLGSHAIPALTPPRLSRHHGSHVTTALTPSRLSRHFLCTYAPTLALTPSLVRARTRGKIVSTSVHVR